MVVRIAIVGPGRVGTAFGQRLHGARSQLLGFVGRDREAAARAAQRVGAGRALALDELATAHVVVFAVGDDALADVVRAAATAGARRCGLWLHTSGRHGLEVLAPARERGMRVGALHPVCPFSEADPEGRALQGAPAVLIGEPRALPLLRRLSSWLGMAAIECGAQDRALYHAGCALLANGLTALFGAAVDVLQAAGGLRGEDARRVAAALGGNALSLSTTHGAAQALTGPVRRGDAETVRAHVDALGRAAPAALPAYRALMHLALQLARQRGLAAAAAEGVSAALEERAWPR